MPENIVNPTPSVPVAKPKPDKPAQGRVLSSAAGARAFDRQGAPLFNRELSWLDYNRRVLAEAEDAAVPLLERLKFLAYCSRNLDEFFMLRVGGIRNLIDAGITRPAADGLTPVEQLAGMRAGARALLADLYACLGNILGELEAAGVSIVSYRDLSEDQQRDLSTYFDRQVAPILTPLAIDPGHPFPSLVNRSLNVAVTVTSERGEESLVILKLPPVLPRFIMIPGTWMFVPIGSLVIAHIGRFFPTLEVKRSVLFRVIRNAEMSLAEDEVEDLRQSIEAQLKRRDRQQVLCVEIDERAGDDAIDLIARGSRASSDDVYRVRGFLRVSDLLEIYERVDLPDLFDPPFDPRIPARLATADDLFSIIRQGDVLLHRPYDSFTAILDFIQTAAEDPDVLAIKQTIYQTDEASPVIEQLVAAALRGKQVTAVVELQAQLEEQQNLAWARRLEDAGVQVVYGLVGIKTHCKLTLVVRREGETLRRYVHLSTGNYNVDSSRTYTDLDLLTSEQSIGEEASTLINMLTGFSLASVREAFESEDRARWNLFSVAPADYHTWLLSRIGREAAHAKAGRRARIVAKLNALADPAVIAALYEASRAGVRIDLIVRGVCCLVPGLPDWSDNIRVISIVDRFLEHSRIIAFENGGEQEVFASSGDWMTRNFQRRVELTFPILDATLRRHVLDQILAISLQDNVKAWSLHRDGTWIRPAPDGKARIRSQELFIRTARSEAVSVGPYEDTIDTPTSVRRKARRAKSGRKRQPALV